MKFIIKNSNVVFQRKHQKQIVYKDYWVRGQGQFIKLSGLGSRVMGLAFNNYKGDSEIYIDTTTSDASCVFISGRSSNLYHLSTGTLLRFANAGNGAEVTISGASDHHINFNNKTGSVTLDSTTQSFTAPGTSTLNYMWLFANGSNDGNAAASAWSPGRLKFKRFRLYNATSDVLLCDLRPAVVDGVPCIYDSVSDTELYSADGTALVLE
jgi:hypothetical protein